MLFFGFSDFIQIFRSERNSGKKRKFFRKFRKPCCLALERGNRNNRIKIFFFKFFVCGKKPITESIETEFIIASELETEQSILCRTFVIKSTGKTVPVISGRGGFFNAFFTKAASADCFSAGDTVFCKKRISESFQQI